MFRSDPRGSNGPSPPAKQQRKSLAATFKVRSAVHYHRDTSCVDRSRSHPYLLMVRMACT
jgi:hypothetical protein